MADYSELLERLRENPNLSAACRDLRISKSTFLDALPRNPRLADQYARAREMGLDAEAERGLSEALAWNGDAALGRLAFDARRWYLSKLAPKKYGDKQHVEHSGTVEVATKEQRDAAVAAAMRADSGE